jgi:hypothetical protein
VMALFGHPVAQENDAERAVRAALAIQRSLAELNRKNEATDKPFSCAIGWPNNAISPSPSFLASAAARPNEPKYRDWLRHAFEFMAAALLGDEQAGDLPLHPRRHHDRTRLGQRLRPRRDIRHVAKNFARRIHHHRSRLDGNARCKRWLSDVGVLAVQLGQRPLDRERRTPFCGGDLSRRSCKRDNEAPRPRPPETVVHPSRSFALRPTRARHRRAA